MPKQPIWKSATREFGERPVATTGVAVAILAKPAHGPEDNPDRCLGIWLSHRPDVDGLAFEKLLTHEELLDEQRKRVWLQVEKTKDLSKSFYLESVEI